MIITKKIPNVIRFVPDVRAIVKTDGSISDLNDQTVGVFEDSRQVFVVDNDFIVLNSLNQSFYLKTGEPFFNEQRISKVDEKYILTYIKKTPRIYQVYLKHNRQLLDEQTKSYGQHIFGDLIIEGLGNSESIIVKNLRLGNTICSFKISELNKYYNESKNYKLEVSEFAGVYSNVLICSFSNGGILLLDLESGKEKVFFKDAKVRKGLYPNEENNGLYYGLSHSTFIEIDINNCIIKEHINLDSELKKLGQIPVESPNWLFISTSFYNEGLYYFLTSDNSVGIFDTEKKKIIDTYKFKFEGKLTQTKSLQLYDNKIYCLDTANVLYILE